MRVRFNCTDGSRTSAASASFALLHWLMRKRPAYLPENPLPLVVYEVGQPIPGPYSPEFLILVSAACEQQFCISPYIEAKFFQQEYYEDIPDEVVDPSKIEQIEHPKVVNYEWICRYILNWLKINGDITEIIIE